MFMERSNPGLCNQDLSCKIKKSNKFNKNVCWPKNDCYKVLKKNERVVFSGKVTSLHYVLLKKELKRKKNIFKSFINGKLLSFKKTIQIYGL